MEKATRLWLTPRPGIPNSMLAGLSSMSGPKEANVIIARLSRWKPVSFAMPTTAKCPNIIMFIIAPQRP